MAARGGGRSRGGGGVGLTVLQVAYPFAPVVPDAVGGAEAVLGWLDEALVAAGHRSVVVACEGSRVAGELVSVPAPGGALDEAAQRAQHAVLRDVLARTADRLKPDVVHLHGIDFAAYLPPAGLPALATLHLPPSWYPAAAFHPSRPDTWLQCVSDDQRAACPPSPALVETVPNGVPVARLGARVSRRRWALAMGRLCPEKGFDDALEAARRADASLLLAGHAYAYPEHRQYVAREIRPRLDGRRLFVGPLSGARKRRAMAAARCLLVPSRAPETSSLVAMEAMASGTPVVARRIGALPEVVRDGVTGFLVDDVAQMADAIHACARLDPDACRAEAVARFSAGAMAARYLALYRRLSRGAATPGDA